MTQTRETLGIMERGPPSLTPSIKSKKGIRVSRTLGLLLAAIYVVSAIAVGLLVYNFAACPHLRLPNDIAEVICNETSPPPRTTERAASQKAEKLEKPDVRLPRSVLPIKYDIRLIPFIFEGNFTFRGEVRILVEAQESTDNITLHAAELVIAETEVTDAAGKQLKVARYSNDTQKDFYVIHLLSNLTRGAQYNVYMKFEGKLNDNLHGFYRSSYKIGNVTRWIGTTQFQPTDARRAFPCFDEPAMKARFNISMAHPKNMSAISNMDSISSGEPVDGVADYVWDHFRESLPMSTYLVAFVVSDFASLSDGNFTVWARPDAIQSAAYALEVGPRILKYFEKFYQIDYPLPKLDMIALPDFNAGAMENWGLLTFRETAMLYDEEVSAKINKPRVATVVAHELAHQWFGNLVTPSWWSDLWLNEGFASYIEYVGVDAVEKDWKSMDQFVLHEIQNVFNLDALSSSHQISVNVGNPDEINEIFDKISYGKGAAIIRMMNHFLTSKVFNKGITNYLNEMKFQSAEQSDLWRALTDQARVDGVFDKEMSVDVIMGTWTLQTGFPVVNVMRNYNANSMTLEQERFMLIPNKNAIPSKDEPKEPLWWIPITYTTKSEKNFNETKPVEWMRGTKKLSLKNTNVSYEDWVIFNIQQTGFYRVNYDSHNWALIISHLNDKDHFEEIAVKNRAQLLDDVLNLALAGKLSYNTALDAAKYLVHEKEFVPWKAGIVGLGYIDSMLSKGPHYIEYKQFILSLIEGIYNETGFADHPNDPMLTIYKRIDIINVACLMGHEDCVRQAVIAFKNWMAAPNPDSYNPISPNLRSTVYCTAVRVGGEEEWFFVRDRFAQAQLGSEKELLLSGLGCTRLPWLITRFLDQAIRNDSEIRKQDVNRVFAAVTNSVIGQPIAFNFIRENWHRLKAYLGASTQSLNTILKYATRKLNTRSELEELRKFSDNRKGELGRTIEQSIEKTEANIIWMSKNYETIIGWLNTNVNIS